MIVSGEKAHTSMIKKMMRKISHSFLFVFALEFGKIMVSHGQIHLSPPMHLPPPIYTSLSLHHHPALAHPRTDRFGPARHPQLGIQRRQMEFDGVFADV